ncbi:MAG: hypothetical protein IJ532_04765 [Alphaproteobacteria bacterium]|nr:hypothetical protein [Alphaproteobacteria bacterium]
MKKFWLIVLLAFLTTSQAKAVNMVQIQSYLNVPIRILGLPDFPPFSYYERGAFSNVLHSVFLEPVLAILEKYNVEKNVIEVNHDLANNVKLLLVNVKSGEAEMFIGAYSDTKLFSGLEVIYPAVVSNPIHLITLPETAEKVKNYGDLRNLRGIASKTEYFSDFVLRKFKELNITYVESPFEAYEMVITGKADYMMGSLYYNKIMASRFGVNDYLTYSKNPIFKIPFFISLSKLMPVLSEYKKVLSEEFSKPEFAMAVKKGILEEVNKEIDKNSGVVPPSFIQSVEPQLQNNDEEDEQDENMNSGHIVEQHIHQKTIDEVLDGI